MWAGMASVLCHSGCTLPERESLSSNVFCCFFLSFFFCWTHSHVLFWATGTPVLDFWWRLLWVSKPEWVLLYSHCGGKYDIHSLRSTSGATYCQPLDGSNVNSLASRHEKCSGNVQLKVPNAQSGTFDGNDIILVNSDVLKKVELISWRQSSV